MTTPPGPAPDPVEAHVADLAAALHGPARAKSRLVEEFREGLLEAVQDLSHDSHDSHDAAAPREHAARQAVREFGTVAELAPVFQRELTIAQARHTARTVMLVAPLLLMCWYLVQTWNDPSGGQPLTPIELLVAHLGGVAASTAVLGAAALVATGALARHLPTPHRLPLIVAWTATTAAAALALSALTLALASILAANWPLGVAAGAVALTFHTRVAASARTCRECARLPVVTQ